jgi:hypothetical protein
MFRIVAALWHPIGPESRYSPIKAADEKIPLSVVRVNNKPQHLVFCLCFAHLLSKHRHLPVESSKRPCLARVCAVLFAPKPGQALKQTQGSARFPYHPPRVALRQPPHKVQNRCRTAAKLCELWTNGRDLGFALCVERNRMGRRKTAINRPASNNSPDRKPFRQGR